MSEYGGPLWDHLMAMDHAELSRRYVDLCRREAHLADTVATYREAVASIRLPKKAAGVLAEAAAIVSAVEDALADVVKDDEQE